MHSIKQVKLLRKAVFAVGVLLSLSICSDRVEAEWARPVRFDDSPEATAAYQSAIRYLSGDQVSKAASILSELLQASPDALVAVEGRGVSVEAAVSELCRDEAHRGDNALQIALSERIGQRANAYRWYSAQSLNEHQSRARVLRDAGLDDQANSLTDDIELFGRVGRIVDGERVSVREPSLPTPGWSVDYLEAASPLPDFEFRVFREWGLVPTLASSPIETDSNVIVRHPFGLDAFDIDSGERQWQVRNGAVHVGRMSFSYWFRQAVTATVFGSPFFDRGRLGVVIAASENEAEGGSIACYAESTGDLLWEAVPAGFPIGRPVSLRGLWWYPVRDESTLGLIAVDPSDGTLAREFRVADLPDDGRGKPSPMFAAATTAAGLRLIVAFDEGLVVSFDTLRGAVDWVRPIGIANDDAHVLQLPPQASPDGGPMGLVPRLGTGPPTVSIRGRVVVASCPGWSCGVTLDVHTGSDLGGADRQGADAPGDDNRPQPAERDVNGLSVEVDGERLSLALGPQSRLARRLIEPTPFSFREGTHLWVQTPTQLRRVGRSDLVPAKIRDANWANTWLPYFAHVISQPGFFALTELLRDEPMWFDNTVAPRSFSPLRLINQAKPVAATPKRLWGKNVQVVSELERRPIRELPSQRLSVTRVSQGGPESVDLAIDAQRRMFLQIRVDGQRPQVLRLPGPNGDQRRNHRLSRSWQVGDLLVVQLGRELFGVRLDLNGEDRWMASIAWPKANGLQLAPQRIRGFHVVAETVDTPAGPLEIDGTGRFIGNVAVSNDHITIARAGCLISLDPFRGQPLLMVADRDAREIVTASGETTWRIDVSSGAARPIAIDSESNDSTRLEPTRCVPTFINRLGRWCYDSDAKLLTLTDWHDITQRWPCEKSAFIAHTDRATALIDCEAGEVVVLVEGRNPFRRSVTDLENLSHVVLAPSGSGYLIGLSEPVSEPGLLDVTQPRDVERFLLNGPLLLIDKDATGKLVEYWAEDQVACAVAAVQPSSAPIVVLSWNAKVADASGRLNSLPVSHIRILNRSNGEILLEEQSGRPISPRLEFDQAEQRVTVQLGDRTHDLLFSAE